MYIVAQIGAVEACITSETDKGKVRYYSYVGVH